MLPAKIRNCWVPTHKVDFLKGRVTAEKAVVKSEPVLHLELCIIYQAITYIFNLMSLDSKPVFLASKKRPIAEF